MNPNRLTFTAALTTFALVWGCGTTTSDRSEPAALAVDATVATDRGTNEVGRSMLDGIRREDAGSADATSTDTGRADGSPPVPPPATPHAATTSIGIGPWHVCLLDVSGALKCSGRVRPIPAGTKGVALSAGHFHACVIAAPSAPMPVACFGDWAGKLTVPDGLDPVQIEAGDFHNCVRNRDGSVRCWGTPEVTSDAPPGLRAKQISATAVYTCAITLDDSVVCWGLDPPVPPAGLKARQVSAGMAYVRPENFPIATRHACAVRMDDTVVCWGTDRYGETRPPAGLRVRQVAIGNNMACAVALDGRVVCWGELRRTGSLPVPTGLQAKAIDVTHYTACAVRDPDNVAVCWGNDSEGGATWATGTKVLSAP